MRFDFFRRPESRHSEDGDHAAVAAETIPSTQGDAGGFVTYALHLDAQKRVRGYRLAWRTASQNGESNASQNFRSLISCIAMNLNTPKTGWRLGGLVLFFDLTADGLFLEELQALPPVNVVLCIGMDMLMAGDIRPMLQFLHAQGYGFMLCGANMLPEDPEALVLITHMDVGEGCPDLVASLNQERKPGMPVIQPIATRMASWQAFDACAARADVFVPGSQAIAAANETGASLQPEAMLIVRLMQMIQRNEDVRTIEAALKHDVALTYRLLRHINSPAFGIGVEIQSLHHAVPMLGYSPLFRWLSMLLATSNKASLAFMTKKAIMRGRFVELMGQGLLAPDDADNLFVVGMFSLIDRLLDVSMEEVLDKVQLSEAVQQAILTRTGIYGHFLALAESCEVDASKAAELSESLFMSADKVNAAHLSALAWAQDVSPAEVTY